MTTQNQIRKCLAVILCASIIGCTGGKRSEAQVSVSYEVSASAVDSSFDSLLQDIESAAEDERQNIADDFLASVELPFIDGDTAVFLIQGDYKSVQVAGDFNNWDPKKSDFTRIASTDTWFRREHFEPTARLDYKLVLDGEEWILDPGNPYKTEGGFGYNSELAMSQYVRAEEIVERPDIAHGTLVSRTIVDPSTGVERSFEVYLPAAYSSENVYGMMLFHDGSDYLNIGAAKEVLDNLIADEKIEPVVGLFVNPVDRNAEYGFDGTEGYETFITSVLVPFASEEYSISSEAKRRATTGVSLGGLISTQLCYRHPEIFGLCAPFSPSYWVADQSVMNELLDGESKDIKFYLDWGTYEPSIAETGRVVRDGLLEKGYEVKWNEWHEGHSWGSWKAHLDEMLIYFFGR